MLERPKRPSLLNQLDASFGSSSSKPRIVSNPEFVKPEPSEHLIPRKRASDSGLPNSRIKRETSPLDFFDPSSGSESFKKIKIEQKIPHDSFNSNTASLSQVPQPSAVGLSFTTATAQLDDVERKLARTVDEFNDLASKQRKTKADLTRFGVLNKNIDRLQAKKNDYNALLTSLAPEGVPNLPNPVQPHSPDKKISYGLSPFHFPAIPSSPFQRPVIHQPQPVASGSNIRLPDAMIYRDNMMDADDGMSSDPDIPDHLRVTLQPGIMGGYGEGFDTDGNFHGRGRDTFVGPQANADEYVGRIIGPSPY